MTCIFFEDILYEMYTRRFFLSLILTSMAIPILPIILKINNSATKIFLIPNLILRIVIFETVLLPDYDVALKIDLLVYKFGCFSGGPTRTRTWDNSVMSGGL